MKKNTFFGLLLAILFTSQTFAQKGFHVGVNTVLGPSFVVDQLTYGNNELETTKINFGMSYGAQVGYGFTDNLGLYIEYCNANIGGKWEETNNGVKIKRELKMNYSEIPILFKYNSIGKTNFFAMAGIQFGTLNKAEQKYTPADTTKYNENKDIKDRFEKSEMSLAFRFGAQVGITEDLYFTAGAAFNAGLGDINKPEWRMKNQSGEYDGARNLYGGLLLGIHYRFR